MHKESFEILDLFVNFRFYNGKCRHDHFLGREIVRQGRVKQIIQFCKSTTEMKNQ